jgi:hypothetical protein
VARRTVVRRSTPKPATERNVPKSSVALAKRFKAFREQLSPEERVLLMTWLTGERPPLPTLVYEPPPITVIYPAPYPAGMFDYEGTFGSPLRLTVEFSWAVDVASVIPQKTLFLRTSKITNAPGTVVGVATSQGGFSAILFTTTNLMDDLLRPRPDDAFTLTLIGTDHGGGAIVDERGWPMDGDADGVPGGDFTTTFTVIG